MHRDESGSRSPRPPTDLDPEGRRPTLTTALDGDSWRDLPTRDKEHLRDRLREACARVGVPVESTSTPGDLAVLHEPHLNHRRDWLVPRPERLMLKPVSGVVG